MVCFVVPLISHLDNDEKIKKLAIIYKHPIYSYGELKKELWKVIDNKPLSAEYTIYKTEFDPQFNLPSQQVQQVQQQSRQQRMNQKSNAEKFIVLFNQMPNLHASSQSIKLSLQKIEGFEIDIEEARTDKQIQQIQEKIENERKSIQNNENNIIKMGELIREINEFEDDLCRDENLDEMDNIFKQILLSVSHNDKLEESIYHMLSNTNSKCLFNKFIMFINNVENLNQIIKENEDKIETLVWFMRVLFLFYENGHITVDVIDELLRTAQISSNVDLEYKLAKFLVDKMKESKNYNFLILLQQIYKSMTNKGKIDGKIRVLKMDIDDFVEKSQQRRQQGGSKINKYSHKINKYTEKINKLKC
jgi:hypothetical protein